MVYFVLAWLRWPIRIVLRLASGLLMLVLILVTGMYFALPQQHDTLVRLLWICGVGSFGAFIIREVYDRLLYRLNLYRLGLSNEAQRRSMRGIR
jgi:lipoprotein signal peptidase